MSAAERRTIRAQHAGQAADGIRMMLIAAAAIWFIVEFVR